MLDLLNNKEGKTMFSTKFDSYVCAGDSITTEIDGVTYTATIVHDIDAHIDDDDSHNTDQGVTGCDDKQQARLLAAREAWFNNEWFFCGVMIGARKGDIEIYDNCASLWSVEANYPGSDNAYLTEVANELLPEAIEDAKKALADMVAKLTA